MSFGLVSLFAFLAAVGAAWTLRNKFFAIFVGVLLGLEGLVATAYEPHVGALRPLFWGLHVTVFLQILSLTRPALRPAWFRVLVSWPAYYFLAATLLGVFWLPILLVASAPASLPVQLVLSVPFVLAAVGMWQSLVGRESLVPLSLLDALGSEGDVVMRHVAPAPGQDASRPLRIVQITDPHLGPFMSVARLRRIAERAVEREPDLIMLTGDFLTMESQARESYLAEAFAPLAALEGRVFACLGNHDHEALHIVKNALAGAKVKLLVDQSALVDTPAGPVQIVGADYHFRGRHEHLTRLAQTHPRVPGALRLWLLHDPGAFRRIPVGDADLVLSGHTHGGQVGLLSLGGSWTPVWSIAKIPDHGLFARGRDRLYIHRGTGHYGFPLRLGVPSEQSLLEVYFNART
ncbi:MAG: metallophosphoesterase [Sandaracinaceae bacterium]|nr:metallophosphoesterase [Sandaracinaceae bacterium]MBK7151462.1 metallophosphoesterase [Sandaracinaceae bacterium]MBK8588418.1 metallophosphoesterase [Sandaracinaceae bacterium]